jgi:F0F1-type ATP synthase assembly protein I
MGPAANQGPRGAELLGLGAFLAVAVVVPLVVGLGIDRAIHTGPLFLLVGLFVGVVAACAVTYTRFRRYL